MKLELFRYLAAGLDVSGLPGVGDPGPGDAQLQTILNIVLVIAGAIAVLVVILSGIRFIISRGNPAETAKARNGIIFALIGLVVIMLAFSIVNFVIFRVT